MNIIEKQPYRPETQPCRSGCDIGFTQAELQAIQRRAVIGERANPGGESAKHYRALFDAAVAVFHAQVGLILYES